MSGILLAERAGMDAGQKEAGRLEEQQAAGADEREVEIARAGAVGIERRVILPAMAGDGAAAEHHDGPRRHDLVDGATERVQLFGTTAEGEAHDVVTLLLLRQSSLHRPGIRRIAHALLP